MPMKSATRLRPGLRVLILLAVLTLVGCGSSGGYPVEGALVWSDDGKPATNLAGGTVVLDSPETRTSGVGEIDKEGKFRVKVGASGTAGLPPGKYRVLVTGPHADEQDDDRGAKKKPERKEVLPSRYQTFETSRLEVTVEAKSNEFTLKLDRVKP